MPYGRDPLSWHYDGYVRQVMIRAIRASRNGRSVRVYIASPRSSFRATDAGGRTAHERAFTRSAYYLMWRVPLRAGISTQTATPALARRRQRWPGAPVRRHPRSLPPGPRFASTRCYGGSG